MSTADPSRRRLLRRPCREHRSRPCRWQRRVLLAHEVIAAVRSDVRRDGADRIILRARFRLAKVESSFIRRETRRTRNLDGETMAVLEAAQHLFGCLDRLPGARRCTWPVAAVPWRACAQRRIAGRATTRAAGLAEEADPRGAMRYSVLCPEPLEYIGANALYWSRGEAGVDVLDYDRSSIRSTVSSNGGGRRVVPGWCAIPVRAAARRQSRWADRIAVRTAEAGLGSFLGVVKLFGPQASGLLSFPMEGYTLALDFPASAKTLALFPRSTPSSPIMAAGSISPRMPATSPARRSCAAIQGLPRSAPCAAASIPRAILFPLQSRRLGL